MDFSPFEGNKKRLPCIAIPALAGFPEIKSKPVTDATAKRIIQSFLESGRSIHSSQGQTLWVVAAYCTQHKVDFEVESSALGFLVRRTNPNRWIFP